MRAKRAVRLEPFEGDAGFNLVVNVQDEFPNMVRLICPIKDGGRDGTTGA